MRLIFMGTPEFAVPSLQALAAAGHKVAAVVTRPDRPRRSRASHPEPSPVKRAAHELGVQVLQPEGVLDETFIAQLKAEAPEAIVVVAYGKLLPPGVLEIPPRWCINLHASLLPSYRGAAPIARAVLDGQLRTGVTTMRMERGLDTGDILMSRSCAVDPLETTGELTARLAGLGASLLIETLEAHAKSALSPIPQDHARATWAPPLTREDGRLDWQASARRVASQIQGCNPWPLATAGLRGKSVQFLRAVACPDTGDSRLPGTTGGSAPEPGAVAGSNGGRLEVHCGAGTRVSILELLFPGRRPISARDALNGRQVSPDDRFTSAPD